MADVERALGHELDPERHGTTRDLNELPGDLVEEARRLGSVTLCHRFLKYYTTSDNWRWLPDFIGEVVEHGVDPRSWRRGGVLFPLIRVEDLVTLSAAQILSELAPRDDERWLQIAPSRRDWEVGEAVTGAPAVSRPELRYDSITPPLVRRLMRNGLEEILDVDDITVATRRWIASRVAGRIESLGMTTHEGDAAALLDAAFGGARAPSEDALLAARGLLRESSSFRDDGEGVPGFRGPAEWYR